MHCIDKKGGIESCVKACEGQRGRISAEAGSHEEVEFLLVVLGIQRQKSRKTDIMQARA